MLAGDHMLYNDADDAAWYLHDACNYLAEAANYQGWRGICFYASALLHYSLQQKYPEAICHMVAGWAVSVNTHSRNQTSASRASMMPVSVSYQESGEEKNVTFPYAHYWLELQGLNLLGDDCVHLFDCAELSNQFWGQSWASPNDLSPRVADKVQYHPVRRDRRVLPAIFPDDLPCGQGAHYICGDAAAFQRSDIGSTPERLIIDLNEDPLWRPGMIRQIVDESDELLVMP